MMGGWMLQGRYAREQWFVLCAMISRMSWD